MKIMGIESSCDETGVGIVELSEDGHMEILANSVASSMEQHARFGGVVPEIASRAHLEAMPQVMQAALNEAGIAKPDAIAATVGPGLAGALLVGASAATIYLPFIPEVLIATLLGVQFSEHGPLLRTTALSGLPPGARQAMVDRSNRIARRFAERLEELDENVNDRPDWDREIDPGVVFDVDRPEDLTRRA